MSESKIDINPHEFKMDDLKKFRACMPAYKFFKRKYGEEVVDLSKRKNEIIDFIQDGKGHWIITLCLALMDDDKKIHLARYVMDEVVRDFQGNIVFQTGKYFTLLVEGEDTTEELHRLLKTVNSEIERMPKTSIMERGRLELYKGLQHMIRAVDEDIDARLQVAIEKFVEAYVHIGWEDDEYAPIDDIRKSKYKHYALYAMHLTGVWPNE